MLCKNEISRLNLWDLIKLNSMGWLAFLIIVENWKCTIIVCNATQNAGCCEIFCKYIGFDCNFFFFGFFCISSDWIGLYCQIEPWAAAGYQLCRQSLGQECRHYALYIPWLQPFHCNTMHYALYIPWLQLFHRHTMHYVLYIRSVQLFHSNTINALHCGLYIRWLNLFGASIMHQTSDDIKLFI